MKRRADNRRRDNVNFCRSEPLSPFKILVSGHTFKIQGQFKFGASGYISGVIAWSHDIFNGSKGHQMTNQNVKWPRYNARDVNR